MSHLINCIVVSSILFIFYFWTLSCSRQVNATSVFIGGESTPPVSCAPKDSPFLPSFFFFNFHLDRSRWTAVRRRLSVGRTRASGKRDAQASSAVGLLRRHLIPYSRRGTRRYGTPRAHRHTRALSRKHVCTRGYARSDGYKCASFHSVPFRHSIRAARLASKLSPARCARISRHRTRHAALVSCLSRGVVRVYCIIHACPCTRVSTARRRPPIGGDRSRGLAAWNAFSFRKAPRIADRLSHVTDRDIAHARPRIIGNYRKLILDREGHRRCG